MYVTHIGSASRPSEPRRFHSEPEPSLCSGSLVARLAMTKFPRAERAEVRYGSARSALCQPWKQRTDNFSSSLRRYILQQKPLTSHYYLPAKDSKEQGNNFHRILTD